MDTKDLLARDQAQGDAGASPKSGISRKAMTLSLSSSLLLLVLLEGLRSAGLALPNALLLFCPIVTWWTWKGGTPAGMLPAAAGILHAVLDQGSLPGLLTPLVTMPLLAILVGRVKTGTSWPEGRLRRGVIICAWCRKARARDGSWKGLENILHEEHGIDATHGICPACAPLLHSSDSARPEAATEVLAPRVALRCKD